MIGTTGNTFQISYSQNETEKIGKFIKGPGIFLGGWKATFQ